MFFNFKNKQKLRSTTRVREDVMNLTVYVVIGLLLAWILYMGYLSFSSSKVKGREISQLAPRLPGLAEHTDKALIYCYSPRCGPCKTMTPVIDELCQKGKPIIKLGLPENLEVAQELGIRATPTLLLVRDGRIAEVNIGAKSQHQVLQLLETA